MKHNYHMHTLFKLASSIEKVAGARIASSLVLKNTILSFGFNQRKTHPFQAKYGKNNESIYLHAEADAIKNALKCYSLEDLKNSVLYICRSKTMNKSIVTGLAKPCEGCMRAIANFNIKRVVYSTDDGYTTL